MIGNTSSGGKESMEAGTMAGGGDADEGASDCVMPYSVSGPGTTVETEISEAIPTHDTRMPHQESKGQ